MSTFDLRPLFHSTIGFDRLANLFGEACSTQKASTYPPYNIVKTGEESYKIVMAIAGFDKKDLTIVAQDRNLSVKGEAQKEAEETEYLHRGIANRSFEKTFQLADHIKVSRVHLKNGLLMIDLVREVPEESKAREIEIQDAEDLLPASV